MLTISIVNKKGYKTLLIDMDPQGNASSSLGVDNFKCATIYDVLHVDTGIQAAILETGIIIHYIFMVHVCS